MIINGDGRVVTYVNVADDDRYWSNNNNDNNLYRFDNIKILRNGANVLHNNNDDELYRVDSIIILRNGSSILVVNNMYASFTCM